MRTHLIGQSVEGPSRDPSRTSMHKIAEDKGRSPQTVNRQVRDHNKGVQKRGYCARAGYNEFTVRIRNRSRFIASKQRYGLLKDDWPMRYSSFEVSQNEKGRSGERELLKAGLPYYPNVSDAAISFFELAVDYFNSYGEIYLVIPDYRARIESLKLAFSRAELQLDSPEIRHNNLIVKVFAKSGLEILTLHDVHPKSDLVKFDVGFQPDNLSVALLSRLDNLKIDGKEFAKWREEGEGVLTERPEEEIRALLKAG